MCILLNQLKNLWREEIKLTTTGKKKKNKVFCTWANFCSFTGAPKTWCHFDWCNLSPTKTNERAPFKIALVPHTGGHITNKPPDYTSEIVFWRNVLLRQPKWRKKIKVILNILTALLKRNEEYGFLFWFKWKSWFSTSSFIVYQIWRNLFLNFLNWFLVGSESKTSSCPEAGQGESWLFGVIFPQPPDFHPWFLPIVQCQ